MNNRSEQHPQDETDIIAPVGYQRPEVVEEKAVTLSRAQVLAIAVIIPVLVIVWFLFTAKSVRLEFTPAVDEISISGGLSFELGGVYLLRQGDYQISATAVGYQPLDTTLTINSARNQNFALLLTKLPGIVGIDTDPPGASVNLLDQELGVTPLRDVELPAGGVELFFSKDRYQSQTSIVDIVGMHQPQSISVQLLPDWADVSVTSIPSGAEIFIDDEPTGVTTPGTIEVLTGEHEIRIALPGHRSHRQRILVAAQEQIALEPVTLQQADGLLRITTIPAGAGVTLNGKFEGESPLELAVRSKDRYRLQVFKAGYARVDRSIEVASNEELDISLALQRLTGEVVVIAEPADAQLYVDGQLRGSANQTIRLPTAAHKLEIRRTGYAGYTTEIVPRNGFAQEVKVRLLTIEEARLAALKPVIRTPLNQELVLLQPEDFTMGASRRQPGRRANETLREITMTRLFYLGTSEVSNAQFKAFAQGHDSGSFEEYALNKDDQPVTRVSWESAALYCNWLSQQEGLPLFYRTEQGKVVGSNPAATGYRLPTEAEWAWAARQVEAAQPLRFPWGSTLPPPDRHGNYADRSAAHLVGRIIFGYNDNHIVSAPIGTFAPNLKGIYDLSGNVSEWTTDFYAIPEATPAADPLGPATGDYRVIRGSSWMHGTITELRIPFRDYGVDARQDVGFRLARFAESN
jgi:formylglycine-generating enzyme required for sulfatase activity